MLLFGACIACLYMNRFLLSELLFEILLNKKLTTLFILFNTVCCTIKLFILQQGNGNHTLKINSSSGKKKKINSHRIKRNLH